MLIGKKWKVESDSLNVILSKKFKRTSRNGKAYEDWDAVGYYSTIEAALKGMVDKGVKETQLKDVKHFIAEIEKLKRDITLVLQEKS